MPVVARLDELEPQRRGPSRFLRAAHQVDLDVLLEDDRQPERPEREAGLRRLMDHFQPFPDLDRRPVPGVGFDGGPAQAQLVSGLYGGARPGLPFFGNSSRRVPERT